MSHESLSHGQLRDIRRPARRRRLSRSAGAHTWTPCFMLMLPRRQRVASERHAHVYVLHRLLMKIMCPAHQLLPCRIAVA